MRRCELLHVTLFSSFNLAETEQRNWNVSQLQVVQAAQAAQTVRVVRVVQAAQAAQSVRVVRVVQVAQGVGTAGNEVMMSMGSADAGELEQILVMKDEDLSKNLVSISRFDVSGHKIIFDEGTCTIVNKSTGLLIGTGHLDRSTMLYMLDIRKLTEHRADIFLASAPLKDCPVRASVHCGIVSGVAMNRRIYFVSCSRSAIRCSRNHNQIADVISC